MVLLLVLLHVLLVALEYVSEPISLRSRPRSNNAVGFRNRPPPFNWLKSSVHVPSSMQVHQRCKAALDAFVKVLWNSAKCDWVKYEKENSHALWPKARSKWHADLRSIMNGTLKKKRDTYWKDRIRLYRVLTNKTGAARPGGLTYESSTKSPNNNQPKGGDLSRRTAIHRRTDPTTG
ncbi:hypothetical protein N658DRAFT_488071 [Parathielavia hyrcaniae]|uniref:Uncharacterized protein n=1 Tax=Parathielavia hyrcaniae TaxID=113614 RepID=A0AAN6PVU6_9PEZI|nr:hypothetical protein N658DRAFT_488071 [Parathielavia hyrcaniae]